MSYIREIVEGMGLKTQTSHHGKELMVNCPFHDDKHPSLYISAETGAWICHAGCGKGVFLEFVNRLQVLGFGPVEGTGEKTNSKEKPLKMLTDRGFSLEVLKKWRVIWNEDIGALEIPAFDVKGEFVGYIWRMPEGKYPKYRYAAGFPRSNILFGLDRLSNRKEVVLTEGPLDAMWVQEAGGQGVALLGAYMSEGQLNILEREGVNRVILCFDNDSAGDLATEAVAIQLKKMGVWVFQALVPKSYKDVQEAPLSKVLGFLKSAHLCVNGVGIIHPQYRRWLEQEVLSVNVSSKWRC